MTTVNLLPWRESRRQSDQRRFIRAIWIVVIFSLAAAWGWHHLLAEQLHHQQQRNAFLQRQLNELTERQQAQHSLLQQRDQQAAQLARLRWVHHNPALMVQMLETLARSVPDRVYLTSLMQDGGVIELTGRVDEAANLTPLLRRLSESVLFDAATLINIETDRNADALASRRFLVQLRSQQLMEEGEAE
ncbi:PilN domain-containing protein [Saccharospirillum mangrovi]|uniref:PilN domain-containing protein n=1 Tax=Saccharospirillum mangrovi TaxID=2161747 RepID=UPI0013002559|nr:PilN domain-containing protein [Saccharospirillum mangrovi]